MNPFPSPQDDLHIYTSKGQLYLSSWTRADSLSSPQTSDLLLLLPPYPLSSLSASSVFGADHQKPPFGLQRWPPSHGLSVLILASAHHCSTCKHSGFSKYKSDHAFWVSPALGSKSNPWPTASVALNWSPLVPPSEGPRGASMNLTVESQHPALRQAG